MAKRVVSYLKDVGDKNDIAARWRMQNNWMLGFLGVMGFRYFQVHEWLYLVFFLWFLWFIPLRK